MVAVGTLSRFLLFLSLFSYSPLRNILIVRRFVFPAPLWDLNNSPKIALKRILFSLLWGYSAVRFAPFTKKDHVWWEMSFLQSTWSHLSRLFFFHQTSTNAPNVRCMGKFSLFSCVKGDVYELKYYVFTISVANPIFFFLKPIKLWVYTIFVLIFIH